MTNTHPRADRTAEEVADGIMAFWITGTSARTRDAIAAAITAAREEEREACAKLAEDERENSMELRHLKTCEAVAAAIRARQTPNGTGESHD